MGTTGVGGRHQAPAGLEGGKTWGSSSTGKGYKFVEEMPSPARKAFQGENKHF